MRKEKTFGAPFSQFMKFNTEFRHLWNMDKNNKIASRVALGALFAYGNATIAPYSEQFYVGGANSIRAFTVRSIGPGGYHPKDSKYSYLDQTGTFRFEANVEYRFRIFKSIWELLSWMRVTSGCCARTRHVLIRNFV